jgi:hypothetical protein
MIVYDKDLVSELTAAYKPVALDIDTFKVEIDVPLEKQDFEEMKNYSTFLQEAQDAIQNDAIKPVIATLARELGKVDRAYYALQTLRMDSEAKEWKDKADKLLKQAVTDITDLAQKALNEVWGHILKLEKNVRIVKLKAATHIVLNCVALGLSIASLATTPVTGAGAVAGALGIVQSVGSLITNVRVLVVRLEKLMKEIQLNFITYRKQVEKLQAQLDAEAAKAKKASSKQAETNMGMKKKEAAKVAVSGLTGGVSDLVLSKMSSTLPSLDSFKSDIDLFGTKTDELETSQKSLSKELNRLLDKSSALVAHYEDLETQFNAYLSDLGKKGAVCPSKVLEAQAKIIMPKKRKAMDYQKRTAEAVKKIEDLRKDVTAYRTLHESFDKKITEMLKIYKTKGVAMYTKLLVALGSAALGGATGNWDKAEDIVQNVYSLGAGLFDANADTLIDMI